MTSDAGLKRVTAAVVGIAGFDLGIESPHVAPTDLWRKSPRALNECGLEVADIDALLCAHSQSRGASM